MSKDSLINIIENLSKTIELKDKQLEKLLSLYESKSKEYNILKEKWDGYWEFLDNKYKENTEELFTLNQNINQYKNQRKYLNES